MEPPDDGSILPFSQSNQAWASVELSKGATSRGGSVAALYEVAPIASIRCQPGLFPRIGRFFSILVV